MKTEDVEVTEESDYPYGSEKGVHPYQYAKSDVATSLAALLSYELKPQVHLAIPMTDNLHVPGEQITYTDEDNFEQDLDVTFYCRNIKYDFERDTVEVSGDGVLT